MHRSTIRRRGSATLWLVIWLPCLLALFSVLLGVSNLWLARVELENAVEAAALAAAKEWGDDQRGETLVAREVGVAYAAANHVRGGGVVLGLNYQDAHPNQNRDAAGDLIFGVIDDSDPDHIVFNANVEPSGAEAKYAVRVEATVPLQPLGGVPFVGALAHYSVQAKATAQYDSLTRRVKLIRVDEFAGPPP